MPIYKLSIHKPLCDTLMAYSITINVHVYNDMLLRVGERPMQNSLQNIMNCGIQDEQ